MPYNTTGFAEYLARLMKSRGLSTGERKMLHTARQIMLSEIVLAMNCEYREVELRLDNAMMQMPAM